MIVHKQKLDIRCNHICKIRVPEFSEMLSVDFQGESLMIWYMFPDTYINTNQDRFLFLLRTGESSGKFREMKFIGTAYDRDVLHPFVIHVFEVIQAA